MATRDYNVINADYKECGQRSWIPFLRQLLVSSAVWMAYFVYGLCVGAPTVFIPQIRKEINSTEAISDEMATWLSSVINFSGFPCVILLSILVKVIGRKVCFIITIFDSFIAFFIFYFSSSVHQILISEIMQGLLAAAQMVVSVVVLAEYTSPKYRGLFLTIKAATYFWGIWVSNAVGTFFHWRYTGVIGISITFVCLIAAIAWPESPYWLASKGRYKECAASHRWLKGCDEDSERELNILIRSQKEYTKNCENRSLSSRYILRDFFTTVARKSFYKPLLLSCMAGIFNVLCGKLVFTVYAIDIVKNIISSESTAYAVMLILDGVTIICMYVGCALSKLLKRRTLLFVSSTIGIFMLYSISLYLYLVYLSLIKENKILFIGLLILFNVAISTGPLILATAICAELIPLRSRSLAVCLLALSAKLCLGVTLKMAPFVFKSLSSHGAFLFFAVSSSAVLSILFKYLPETKDKTLQEVADVINGVKKGDLDEGGHLLYITHK